MAYYKRPDDGKNALQRYREKCDCITIRPLKAEGEKIRSAALSMGYDNLTKFVLTAINKYIENHKNDINEGEKE